MTSEQLLAELQDGSGAAPHYRFHPRVWEQDGCVVDLGCLGWDWSRLFMGRRRVVGADPAEADTPSGSELWRGFVAPMTGELQYGRGPSGMPAGSALIGGKLSAPALSWQAFKDRFVIQAISLLKMNIEGMEYSLLPIVPQSMADQIVVSFHHPFGSFSPSATRAMIGFLSEWYWHCETCPKWGWHLFLRKR